MRIFVALLALAAAGCATDRNQGAVAAAVEAKPAAPAAPAPPAAPPQPAFMEEINAAMREMDSGRYLAAIDRLAAGARNPDHGPGNPFRELWGQMHSFIGGTVDPSLFEDKPLDPLDEELAGRIARAEPRDALAEIVRRAGETRIVILNEAHHSPRDRAFALQVARALRPLGYRYLAAETFVNTVSGGENEPAIEAMAADGFPRLKHGMYLKDPVFGDFVRQAMGLGYRPVAYEMVVDPAAPPPADRLAHREQMQADQLIARILARDLEARVLVYVGYAHAAEEPLGKSGARWMAARLKEATGIDPLTIDQTTVSELSLSAADRRLYDLLRPKLPARPVSFMVEGQPLKLGPVGQATDLQVVHPPEELVEGRPSWLLSMGRRAVPVPEDLRPSHGRRLVQAFLADEPADAVPIDQVLVIAGQPAPSLMLPERPVRLVVQDPPG